MRKQQLFGLMVLLLVTAAVIGGDWFRQRKMEREAEAAYAELLAAAPVAQVEGEPISPDGRFRVETVGADDFWVGGVRVPEHLQVVERETGEVLWRDTGDVFQSAVWSPDSAYLALAYGGRTWEQVKVIETETWTAWDVTLPDGDPIPEYTFLPEDWGQWQDDSTLLLTVGRGGDAGEQHVYRCLVSREYGTLDGSTLEQITEVLPGTWDFDHDGTPETVELITVGERSPSENLGGWYELRILRQDGALLGKRDNFFTLAHVGWGSIFARTMEGKDYLFVFRPTMYQGDAEYTYEQIFFDLDGTESLSMRNAVSFDVNFTSPAHREFDAAAIADFLWEVRGYLADSTLLLSTEGGEFLSDVPGLELQNYLFGDLTAQAESREELEAAIRQAEREMRQGM